MLTPDGAVWIDLVDPTWRPVRIGANLADRR